MGSGTTTTTAYECDAENWLVAVVTGNQRSEFKYDGSSRRTKIVEKLSGAVQSTKQFVWVGGEIAEERDGSNAVQKKFTGGRAASSSTDPYTRTFLFVGSGFCR